MLSVPVLTQSARRAGAGSAHFFLLMEFNQETNFLLTDCMKQAVFQIGVGTRASYTPQQHRTPTVAGVADEMVEGSLGFGVISLDARQMKNI